MPDRHPVLASTPVKQIAIGLGIAVGVLAMIIIVTIASSGGATSRVDKAACEAAIRAITNQGGEASTPPECEGLTDAEIGEIARRAYADKDRIGHD